jgi:hypothetical protein
LFRFTEIDSAQEFFKRKDASTNKREMLRALSGRKGSKGSAFSKGEGVKRGDTVKNSCIRGRGFKDKARRKGVERDFMREEVQRLKELSTYKTKIKRRGGRADANRGHTGAAVGADFSGRRDPK